MQAHRFRADIRDNSGARIKIMSTNWQTVSLMTPQDGGYRAFITELHARMRAAGSSARLTGGLSVPLYTAALAFVALLAVAMMGLFVRALATGELAGALFLVGFAACSPGRSAASSGATGRSATASIACRKRCCPDARWFEASSRLASCLRMIPAQTLRDCRGENRCTLFRTVRPQSSAIKRDFASRATRGIVRPRVKGAGDGARSKRANSRRGRNRRDQRDASDRYAA